MDERRKPWGRKRREKERTEMYEGARERIEDEERLKKGGLAISFGSERGENPLSHLSLPVYL